MTGVLLWYIHTQISCEDPDDCGRCDSRHGRNVTAAIPGITPENVDNNKIMCWETYLAQQLWRIIIVNFLVECLVAFIVEPLRNFVGKTN